MAAILRNPSLRRLVRWLVLGTLLGFWALYLWQNAGLLLESRWQFDPWLFAAGVGLGALAYGAFAVAWLVTVRQLGGQVPAGPGLRRWYQSLVMKYTPGGVWHIAGRSWLLHGDGHSIQRSLLSAVVEQGLTVTAALAMAGAGLLLAPVPEGWAGVSLLVPLAGAAVLVVALAMTHPALFRRWTWLASWPITLVASRTPLARREEQSYAALFQQEVGSLRWATLLALSSIYLAGMVLSAMSLLAVALALGADPPLVLAGTWAAFAISWLAGYVILVTPGGLGTREAVLVLLGEPFLDPALALGVALLSRVAITAGELIAIGLGILLTSRAGRHGVSPASTPAPPADVEAGRRPSP